MFGYCLRLLLLFLALLLIATDISAHDSWISRGGHRNGAGEWCCGEGDCFALPHGSVGLHADGYHIHATTADVLGTPLPPDEVVPLSEAQPSPDGAFWRCKRPDGSRRCFFAPPPGS